MLRFFGVSLDRGFAYSFLGSSDIIKGEKEVGIDRGRRVLTLFDEYTTNV